MMLRPLSVRMRLTLWYLAALTLIIAAFSVGTYLFTRAEFLGQLQAQLDAEVAPAAELLPAHLELEGSGARAAAGAPVGDLAFQRGVVSVDLPVLLVADDEHDVARSRARLPGDLHVREQEVPAESATRDRDGRSRRGLRARLLLSWRAESVGPLIPGAGPR